MCLNLSVQTTKEFYNSVFNNNAECFVYKLLTIITFDSGLKLIVSPYKLTYFNENVLISDIDNEENYQFDKQLKEEEAPRIINQGIHAFYSRVHSDDVYPYKSNDGYGFYYMMGIQIAINSTFYLHEKFGRKTLNIENWPDRSEHDLMCKAPRHQVVSRRSVVVKAIGHRDKLLGADRNVDDIIVDALRHGYSFYNAIHVAFTRLTIPRNIFDDLLK